MVTQSALLPPVPARAADQRDVAASEYLAFRWLARPDTAWSGMLRPNRDVLVAPRTVAVSTVSDIRAALADAVRDIDVERTGLLLSAGMDSAILAALAPRGLRAYTIRFNAPGAVDESRAAAIYASNRDLTHTIVTVDWPDYERFADALMLHKCAPLHPVEVALYKAALQARRDGLTTLVVGNGADSTFGGLDKLLSRDWTFDEFVDRYTFVKPSLVLRRPAPLEEVFEPYRQGDAIDVSRFLKIVHGEGVTQAFANALHLAGCAMRAPYEDLQLAAPLDLARIRTGESKYLLRELFQSLYPSLAVPGKIPFARPMDHWMGAWTGAQRPELLPPPAHERLTGEQRWQVYSLARWLTLLERLDA